MCHYSPHLRAFACLFIPLIKRSVGQELRDGMGDHGRARDDTHPRPVPFSTTLSVAINNGIGTVPAEGSRKIAPYESTTYTMTAQDSRNPADPRYRPTQAKATIAVTPSPSEK